MSSLNITYNELNINVNTKRYLSEIGKSGARVARRRAPVDSRRTSRKGTYKRSIATKTSNNWVGVGAIAPEYRLVHILENGTKYQRAQPHMKYAYKDMESNIEGKAELIELEEK